MPEKKWRIEEWNLRIIGQSNQQPDQIKPDLARMEFFAQRRRIGSITFMDLGILGKMQDEIDAKEMVHGHMCIAELPSVLDILKNIKTVYFVWDDDNKRVILETMNVPK